MLALAMAMTLQKLDWLLAAVAGAFGAPFFLVGLFLVVRYARSPRGPLAADSFGHAFEVGQERIK